MNSVGNSGGGLRIGFLAFSYPPEQIAGGIGTYTRVLALTLKQMGHFPHVFLTDSDGPRHVSEEGVPIHRIGLTGTAKRVPFPIGRGASMLFARSLSELARELQLDILEAPEFVGMMAFFDWWKPRSLTSIVHLHTGYGVTRAIARHLLLNRRDRLRRQTMTWAERRTILRADGACAASHALAETTRRLLHIPRNDFQVIPCPVDTMFFESAHHIVEEAGMVLFVGRLEWQKGIDRLFRVMPQIVAEYPNVRFVLAGSDTNTGPGGASMKSWLVKQIPQAVRRKVEILGAVTQRQLWALYHQASVCVLPSRWEGFPIAIQEALVCGKAVVLSNAAAMPEMVQNGETGIIIDADNADEFADAILLLLRDPQRRKHLGDAAHQQASKLYHPIATTQRMLQLYKQTRLARLV